MSDYDCHIKGRIEKVDDGDAHVIVNCRRRGDFRIVISEASPALVIEGKKNTQKQEAPNATDEPKPRVESEPDRSVVLPALDEMTVEQMQDYAEQQGFPVDGRWGEGRLRMEIRNQAAKIAVATNTA